MSDQPRGHHPSASSRLNAGGLKQGFKRKANITLSANHTSPAKPKSHHHHKFEKRPIPPNVLDLILSNLGDVKAYATIATIQTLSRNCFELASPHLYKVLTLNNPSSFLFRDLEKYGMPEKEDLEKMKNDGMWWSKEERWRVMRAWWFLSHVKTIYIDSLPHLKLSKRLFKLSSSTAKILPKVKNLILGPTFLSSVQKYRPDGQTDLYLDHPFLKALVALINPGTLTVTYPDITWRRGKSLVTPPISGQRASSGTKTHPRWKGVLLDDNIGISTLVEQLGLHWSLTTVTIFNVARQRIPLFPHRMGDISYQIHFCPTSPEADAYILGQSLRLRARQIKYAIKYSNLDNPESIPTFIFHNTGRFVRNTSPPPSVIHISRNGLTAAAYRRTQWRTMQWGKPQSGVVSKSDVMEEKAMIMRHEDFIRASCETWVRVKFHGLNALPNQEMIDAVIGKMEFK